MTIGPDPRIGMNLIHKATLTFLKTSPLQNPLEWHKPRILAVQIAGMGDLVLAVPALRVLREAFSAKSLDILTSTKGRQAAEGCPYIDNIYSLDTRSIPGPGENYALGWIDFLSQIRKIRKNRYDLAINLIGHYSPQGAVRMGLLLKILGIPLLAGRNTLGVCPFYHFALPEELITPRNERDTNMDLVRLLCPDREVTNTLEVWPSKENEKEAAALLSELDGEGPIIGVNPGTDRPEKLWAVENFLDVMRALQEEKNARFILTGGPAEKAMTNRIARLFGKRAVNSVEKISFQGTAALLRKIDLFLTLDTAALHLAWACGVPTVALFKKENLGRYQPETDRITCLTGSEKNSSSPLEIPVGDVIRTCFERMDSKKIDGIFSH